MNMLFQHLLFISLNLHHTKAGAQAGISSGRRIFLELGHFDKQSSTTRERKALQGKNLRFFLLETLKNFTLN